MNDKSGIEFVKEWKTIPMNKILVDHAQTHDIVKVLRYSVYGKKYVILEYNGSFFIQSNVGNVHTCLEKIINETQLFKQ